MHPFHVSQTLPHDPGYLIFLPTLIVGLGIAGSRTGKKKKKKSFNDPKYHMIQAIRHKMCR